MPSLVRCPDEVIAVVGGDHHMHNHSQFNDPGVGEFGSRIERSVNSLEYAATQAHFYGCALVHNGDLQHLKNSIIPQVQAALFKFLMRHEGLPIFLSTGNHERPDRHTNMSTLAQFGILPNVFVAHKPCAAVIENKIAAFFLPYYSTEKDRLAGVASLVSVMSQESLKGLPKVLFAHYPVQGAVFGNGITMAHAPSFESFGPQHFDLMLFSDIHKKQPIGINGYHLGATHSNSFNEATYDCHWWLLGTDKDGLCIWPTRQADLPQFKIAKTDEEAEQLRAGKHFVRLSLEKRIEQQIEASEAPRIATANLKELIDGYIEYRLPGVEGLSDEDIKCINERITWCLAQGASNA